MFKTITALCYFGGTSKGVKCANSKVKWAEASALDATIDIRKGNRFATLFNAIHDLRFSYFE